MNKFLSLFILSNFILLSACVEAIDNDKLHVDVIDQNIKDFNVEALPLPKSSAELRNATAQGLVKFTPSGNIVPALASRWIVTDDGLSYIFRLDKTWWKNGEAVTADDVAASLRENIAKIGRSNFADEMESIQEIIARTGRIIEIRLSAPRPNLLELLAQPEMGLIHTSFGNGPMQAKKELDHMRLRHITYEEGEIVSDDAWVVLNNMQAPLALSRFIAGDTDLIIGGQFQDLPYVTASVIEENILSFDPVPGLFGLLFVKDSDYLADEEVREALTMAVDRPRLLIDFRTEWREVVTLVPETLQNRAAVERPVWNGLRIDQRIDRARQIIARWKSENGNVRDLRMAIPEGPGGDILFARLKSDMANIGIKAVKTAFNQNADLRLIDKVAELSSPLWYLSQLSCKKTIICDEEADELVNSARNSINLTERSQLLAAAERRIQQKRNFIPIANPSYWSIARPGLLGFSANPRGLHPLQYLGQGPI